VADNLRFGHDDIPEEDLLQAATVAQALDFIQERPGGLGSTIDQGGLNLSGGQKQRLAIARALVKKPSVYLFDDSFSALDFKTDIKLRSALKKVTADATVIIVAQRVSTVRDADQILVLDEGRLAGVGRHGDLLRTCEVYREIVASQMSEEEAV
jgi:ATP-binding cassette subfamily B protein